LMIFVTSICAFLMMFFCLVFGVGY